MAADIVITKPAKKEVAIKRAAAKSVVVDPVTGGGGGGGVKLIPTVEVSGDNLIFHFVTLQQMTMMHVSVSGGSIGFELTEDEEDFQLRYSQSSPSPLAGEIIYEDSIAIKDYVFGSIPVAMNGNTATFVTIDGVDANLLEADINWRLADIQKRIGEGGEDPYSQALAQFFGLPEALPQFTYATEQEVKDINDDVMGALYGYGKVTVTMHSLMRTGAETTQDLASVIYVDPEKTWAENGYPTLYDDEGEPIDTTSNPAAGDEVFNYQIQSES